MKIYTLTSTRCWLALFSFAIQMSPQLSFANLNHLHLLPTHILGTHLFSSFQEVHSRETNYFDEIEFVQERSLWIETMSRQMDQRIQSSEKFKKEIPESQLNLITIEKEDTHVTLKYSVTNINSDDPYHTSLSLHAKFIEGNWTDYLNGRPFVLQLTDKSQNEFNNLMLERFILMIFLNLEHKERLQYQKKGVYIHSVEFSELKTLENVGANHYFNKFNTSHELDFQGTTYFFGSAQELVSLYPNYLIRYSIQLSHSPKEEIDWKMEPSHFRTIQHLTSIDLNE